MTLGMMKGVAMGEPAIDQLFDRFRDAYKDAVKYLLERVLGMEPSQKDQQQPAHK
jgi:hypothetical protein